jgi:hypothetical protein
MPAIAKLEDGQFAHSRIVEGSRQRRLRACRIVAVVQDHRHRRSSISILDGAQFGYDVGLGVGPDAGLARVDFLPGPQPRVLAIAFPEIAREEPVFGERRLLQISAGRQRFVEDRAAEARLAGPAVGHRQGGHCVRAGWGVGAGCTGWQAASSNRETKVSPRIDRRLFYRWLRCVSIQARYTGTRR